MAAASASMLDGLLNSLPPVEKADASPPALAYGLTMAMLLTFFGVVIGVDVAFSVLAVRTFPGEDIRNSYVQGNHYNETLAERAPSRERSNDGIGPEACP
jgi:hypothetical protein